MGCAFRRAARVLAEPKGCELTDTVMNDISPRLSELADRLYAAEQSRSPIGQPSAADPELTVDDAYAVQGANVARKLADGARKVGHKIGLTSLAMQEQLGVDQPDFGVITDRMVIANGGTVDLSTMIAPRVEAEFAFRIGSDLPAAPELAELISAIDGVAVALEIIDSRVADWKIGLVDTVADNASSAYIVTGPMRPATSELLASLPEALISMSADGVELCAGPGSAVLGDPLISLHWLAQAIGRYGDAFAAGDVVLAGAVAKAMPLTAGTAWTAHSEGFEPVELFSSDLPENE